MYVNTILKFKEEIEQILPLKSDVKIAIALSGGCDSVALVFLVNEILKETNWQLFCITIDHRLRENSTKEAIQVNKMMIAYGINHIILPWEEEKPKSNIQAKARIARYQLLTNFCKSNNIGYLLTAHQKNDQAENFIIRVEHGSGLYGLSGIAKIAEFNQIKIIRPLLTFSREELENFLRFKNIEWIEDPSNQNEKFARVRARKFLSERPQLINKLADISKNLNNAKECVEYILERAVDELLEINDNAIIDLEGFNKLPQEIRFRMLAQTLQIIGKEDKMARGERIERLITKIACAKEFKAATLAKCLIKRKANKIIISPEFKDEY